jgi:hypothetical protein
LLFGGVAAWAFLHRHETGLAAKPPLLVASKGAALATLRLQEGTVTREAGSRRSSAVAPCELT